jgi:hypothetical protein
MSNGTSDAFISSFYPLETEFFLTVRKHSFRTSQKTYYVSAIKICSLTLCKGNSFYCGNQTKYANTLCEQNAEYNCVKAGGTAIHMEPYSPKYLC